MRPHHHHDSSHPKPQSLRHAAAVLMRRLIAHSAWLTAGTGVAQALTAAAYWLCARASEPAEFGTLVALVSLAMLVATAADFGVNAWTVREIARLGTAEPFIRGLGARFVIALLVGGAWLLCATVLWAAGLASAYLLALGAWIIVTLLMSIILSALRALERMATVATVTSLERLGLLGVVVAGSWIGEPTSALAVGLLVGAAVAVGVAWWTLPRSFKVLSRPHRGEIVGFLVKSRGFAYSSFAVQAQRLDVAIISVIAGPTAAGIYAAPSRLTNALGVLPIGFSAAVFPHVAREDARGPQRRELSLALALLFASMLVMVTPLFIYAERVTSFALGAQYRDSAPVLRFVLIVMLVATLTQPLAVMLQARGEEFFVARILGLSSAIGLIAVAVGAVLGEATGAAAASVGVQVLMLVLLLFGTRQRGYGSGVVARADL